MMTMDGEEVTLPSSSSSDAGEGALGEVGRGMTKTMAGGERSRLCAVHSDPGFVLTSISPPSSPPMRPYGGVVSSTEVMAFIGPPLLPLFFLRQCPCGSIAGSRCAVVFFWRGLSGVGEWVSCSRLFLSFHCRGALARWWRRSEAMAAVS